MMMSVRISSKKQPLLCSTTCTCLFIIVLFVISLGAHSTIAVAAVSVSGERRNLEHHGGDHDNDNDNNNNNDPQPQPQPQPPPTLAPNEISANIPPPSFEPDDVAIPTPVTATIVSETNREEKDIPGVAMEAGVFTTLIAALIATNLVGTLSAPNGPLTVFAPTDDAFDALPDGLIACLLEEEKVSLLSNILLYHVVSGPVVSSTDLLNMNGKSSIPTLFDGHNLMVGLHNNNNNNGDDNDVKINDSIVIFPDVLASNGVIQIIDQVLVPPSIDISAFLYTCDNGSSGHGSDRSSVSSDNDSPLPSSLLYDIPTTAINGGIFSTLVAALSVTDLISALSEPNGPYTVFAPTDDAFAALPEGLLVCLLEEDNVPILSNILLYHVAPGQTLVSTDLVNSMHIPTLFERQNVMVTLHNNNNNYNSGDGDVIKIDEATVLFPDVRASNGMMHIIDQVLIPPSIDIPAFLASSCGGYSRTNDDTHNNKYDYAVPEPILSTDPYRQQSTGTTTSSRQQQQPTMYPTGTDPYNNNQHQHEIYSDSSTTTTSRTNDPYRQQPPTMYPTGTDPYKQEIYYDSSKYYDYSTTTIMNRYHYYAPLSRREKVPPPPTLHPTPVPPTHYPTCSPTLPPTPQPTPNPTPDPTPRPTSLPTPYPTPLPTPYPTPLPTPYPTPFPTQYPTPSYPNKPIIYPEPYYSPIYPVYQEPKPYNPPPPPKTYPIVYQEPVDENFYQEQPNNDPYYHEDPHPPYYPEPDPAYYDSRQQHNDDPSVGPYVRTHNNPN